MGGSGSGGLQMRQKRLVKKQNQKNVIGWIVFLIHRNSEGVIRGETATMHIPCNFQTVSGLKVGHNIT